MNEKYIQIFKALSDDIRLEILEMVSKKRLCACEILERFNITQPTLSHHMKTLCDSGLVLSEKCGKWNYYQVNPELIKSVCTYFNTLSDFSLSINKCEVNDDKCTK